MVRKRFKVLIAVVIACTLSGCGGSNTIEESNNIISKIEADATTGNDTIIENATTEETTTEETTEAIINVNWQELYWDYIESNNLLKTDGGNMSWYPKCVVVEDCDWNGIPEVYLLRSSFGYTSCLMLDVKENGVEEREIFSGYSMQYYNNGGVFTEYDKSNLGHNNDPQNPLNIDEIKDYVYDTNFKKSAVNQTDIMNLADEYTFCGNEKDARYETCSLGCIDDTVYITFHTKGGNSCASGIVVNGTGYVGGDISGDCTINPDMISLKNVKISYATAEGEFVFDRCGELIYTKDGQPVETEQTVETYEAYTMEKCLEYLDGVLRDKYDNRTEVAKGISATKYLTDKAGYSQYEVLLKNEYEDDNIWGGYLGIDKPLVLSIGYANAEVESSDYKSSYGWDEKITPTDFEDIKRIEREIANDIGMDVVIQEAYTFTLLYGMNGSRSNYLLKGYIVKIDERYFISCVGD